MVGSKSLVHRVYTVRDFIEVNVYFDSGKIHTSPLHLFYIYIFDLRVYERMNDVK